MSIMKNFFSEDGILFLYALQKNQQCSHVYVPGKTTSLFISYLQRSNLNRRPRNSPQ